MAQKLGFEAVARTYGELRFEFANEVRIISQQNESLQDFDGVLLRGLELTEQVFGNKEE